MKSKYIALALSIVTLVCCTIILPSVSMAEEGGNYYRLKLLVETDSDWTHITPLPPWDEDWHVTETKIIEPEKDQQLIKIRRLNIHGQDYDDTAMEIEFVVYFKAQDEDLEFVITKGSIGSTTVKAFNTSGEKEYRIGKYTNSESDSDKNPSEYKMSIKKISKFGKVEFTPPRKGKKK